MTNTDQNEFELKRKRFLSCSVFSVDNLPLQTALPHAAAPLLSVQTVADSSPYSVERVRAGLLYHALH